MSGPDVDTVIVGNGPAALILSFILHGNTPYYNPDHPHPDPILHAKLEKATCLLDLDVDELTAHFEGSRIPYSTQALPVNVLLDTLLRPLADVEPGEHESCVVWRKETGRAVPHIVIGDSPEAGGQWADNPVSASWDIGALSYLDQLSLPGYTIYDHLGLSPKSLKSNVERPTRRQLASYFAAYPAAVGIKDSVRSGESVSGVRRTSNGFYIGSHDLHCRSVVLASGTFTKLLQPPSGLDELTKLNSSQTQQHEEDTSAVLVIGSGFSAADIIISNVEKRKVVHIFKWRPSKPSPLQACHPHAYPDYAGVYRQMKRYSSSRTPKVESITSSTPRKAKPLFDDWVWTNNYEGFPNGVITSIRREGRRAMVEIEASDQNGTTSVTHEVGAFAYVVGRRGSLSYLDEELQLEVLDLGDFGEPGVPTPEPNGPISGDLLRDKAFMDVEVAPAVFAIGSLTGDSLIRFAVGSCMQAASRIIARADGVNPSSRDSRPSSPSTSTPRKTPERRASPPLGAEQVHTYQLTNGHEDLGRMRSEAEKEEEDDSTAAEDSDVEVGGCEDYNKNFEAIRLQPPTNAVESPVASVEPGSGAPATKGRRCIALGECLVQ